MWSLVHYDTRLGGSGWVMALKRSRSSLIAVECVGQSLKPPEPFWSIVKAHSFRWVSLAIRTPGDWVKFDGIHAPILNELRLSIQASAQLAISRENFPKMSFLTLTTTSLRDWGPGTLSGLQYLCLESSAYPPSLSQLLDTLAANPHLEYLALSKIYAAADYTSVRIPAIQLPDLRNLTMDTLPAILMDVILRSIHVAYCPIIYLDFAAQAIPTVSLFPTIASFLTPSLYYSSITQPEAIVLNLATSRYQFGMFDDQDCICHEATIQVVIWYLPVNITAISEWLDDVAESRPPDLRPLRLGISFSEKQILDQICASKWSLAHVEMITIRFSGRVAATFCQLMSSPVDFGEGRYGWLGPDVRKIVFNDCKGLNMEVVLEMVRRRMTASRGPDHSSPAVLEKIVILGHNSLPEVSPVEVEAGQEQMSCEDVMEAVEWIIAAGTYGNNGDGGVAKEGYMDNATPDVIVS
ncbi:hypothetical protein FRB93_005267 [Tulasnella sp. JGI-2019a]|nr:hypothetical protein FRB93_005267 [Tulasnella sp. JGI-2019a]